ncbi:MAG: alpha/beta fold hydrolase [Acidimicrobiia bacterium]|nr:alpha/beta fold hydrolase [Acidimicrobiia bacterium]
MGIAVSGRGVPLVVIHGFSAEGFLYAQTLNRLVLRGFKVVAIDMAGHGGTQGLPMGGGDMAAHGELLGRALHELGIRKAVLAGHSMGGRVITDLATSHRDAVVALLLIDAIVGDTWDHMVTAFRFAPWLMGPFGAALLADSGDDRAPPRGPRAGHQVPPPADPDPSRSCARAVAPGGSGDLDPPFEAQRTPARRARRGPRADLRDPG